MASAAAGGIGPGERKARAPRWIALAFAALGVALLGGAGLAAWSELKFRRIAVETQGRVVGMEREVSRRSEGRRSVTYRPVFRFVLPDGREIEAEGSVASNPPCCAVGETVRVRYDPARPERAAIAGFMESWFLAVVLGGMGLVFTLLGLLGLRYGVAAGPGGMAGAPAAGLLVPLVGLRRETTASGPRWIVQARWTDPASGASRLIESEPLPFDPVPQMRDMTHVRVAFDPAAPHGPAEMDLSFLVPPEQGG